MIRRLLDRIERRRRRQYAGCIDCGSTITQYVVLNDPDMPPADCALCPACATCPGNDLRHVPILRMPHAVDWTVGEIEDRVRRYEAVRARNADRRDRVRQVRFLPPVEIDRVPV